MFIAGFTIAVIPFSDTFYLFDLHSRNERGSLMPDSKSVLLKMKGFIEIKIYIHEWYLQ